MTFTANVPAGDIKSLKYQWTVSAGTILGGQGTPSMEIQTTRDMSFTSVTATVEVYGLASGCPNSVSASAGVGTCRLPITIDEWGRLPFRDEAMRLITAGMEAKSRPDFHLLFLIRLGPKETRRIVDTRVARIRTILESKTGLPKNKVHFIYSAWEQTYTRIYLVSEDVIDPLTQGNEATKNLEELRAIPKTPRRLSESH